MDDQINQSNISTDDAVGFPTPAPKKKGKPTKWVLIFLVILLILAGGAAFFIYNSNQTIEPEPTPQTTTFEESTPEPEPTEAPIDRSEVSIQVLNGTGITGEANYLETQLKALGYEKIDKGNAAGQNETATTVIFASSVAKGVQDEIMKKLGELYNKVEEGSGTTGAGIDIKITTGLRKGASPKATATTVSKSTATPKATAASSGTPKPSASPSPTASGSPKPTATP